MCISVSDILFNIYRWFANIELMANSTITDAWTKFIWHMYFLCKAHHSHLALRDTRQNFITMLGLSLNNKIINKKHKNAKKKKITSIKWTVKKTLVQPQLGDMYIGQLLCMSVNDCKIAINIYLGLQIRFSE